MSIFPKGGGAAADDQFGAACRAEIQSLTDVYEGSPLPALATAAIVEEILRSRLRWSGMPDETPPPLKIPDILHRAVKSVLTVGYFAYRIAEPETEGDVALIIADPVETYPVKRAGRLTVASNRQHKRPGDRRGATVWDAIFFTEPLFYVGGEPFIKSKVRTAAVPLAQLAAVSRNFDRRDAANSRQSGYATVSSALAAVGNETWFKGRDREADAALAPYLSRPHDFAAIVANRAKTIRTLGAESIKQRIRTAPQGQQIADPTAKQHSEHIISDGYAFSEATPLQSMGNAPHQYDRLETSCFFALGVPPQALGKNINSERLASANSLTQAALRMFGSFCARFRHSLGALIKAASTHGATHIAFSPTVKDSDVEEVSGLLTTEKLVAVLSSVHDLPENWFDKNRVATHQDTLIGIPKQGDVSALKRSRTPGKTAESMANQREDKDDNIKRHRTEKEAVSAEKKSAKAPN